MGLERLCVYQEIPVEHPDECREYCSKCGQLMRDHYDDEGQWVGCDNEVKHEVGGAFQVEFTL